MNGLTRKFIFGSILLCLGAVAGAFITSGAINIGGYVISFVSLAISAVALIIAINTYAGIDSVNGITSMTGNVLENENYDVASGELISEFVTCHNESEFKDKLIEVLEYKEPSKTVIEYTDHLQNFIDHIIWFAYFKVSDDKDGEKDKKRILALTETLDDELDRFQNLSNGIQYLLSENEHLIKYVLEYQSLKRNADLGFECNLENIRGHMFINPITAIVYFDYYGLDQLSKARFYIKQHIGNKDVFDIDSLEEIKSNTYQDREKILMYLDHAENLFEKALTYARSDTLWNGYVLYNVGRTKLLRYVVDSQKKEDLLEAKAYIERAVKERTEICYMYDSGFNPDSGKDEEFQSIPFLCQKFREERTAAIKMNRNIDQILSCE